MTKELRGMAFMYGVAFGLMFGGGFGGTGIYMIFRTAPFDSWAKLLPLIFAISIFALGIGLGSFFFSLLARFDLYRPSDLPIIFDRQHRKVYRLLQDEQPGIKGMFKRWPVLACEYDWDLIDAEHHVDTYVTAAGVNRNHNLVFIVRKSQDDPTPIDMFQIANAHALGENLVDSVWEHIRRFMEEHGPHLPDPTEPLASAEAPLSWWESMGVVGPYGPKFSTHWNNAPALTLFILLLFPVTLPILLLWGTGNYLSFKTEIPVAWPATVMERIGVPMAS